VTRRSSPAFAGHGQCTLTPLSFEEAKAMGEAMFDRWEQQAPNFPPFSRDDSAWADMVRVAYERLIELRRPA
jgi:hypothetical protein